MKGALIVLFALVALVAADCGGDSCGCGCGVDVNVNIGKDPCKKPECACPCPGPEPCEDCYECCEREYPCPTCPPLDTCESLECNGGCDECEDYEGDLSECCPEICYECIGVYEPYDGQDHSIVIFCGEEGNQVLSFVEGSTLTIYNNPSPDVAVLKGNLETTGGAGRCLGGENFYVEISMIRVDADGLTVKIEQNAEYTDEWRFWKFLSAKLVQTDCTDDCQEWDMEIRHDDHAFQLGLGASLKDPENAVFGASTWIKVFQGEGEYGVHYYGDINIKFHELCPECPPDVEAKCETAFGFLPESDKYDDETSICFTEIDGLKSNNWGWSLGDLKKGTTYDDIEIWAGAGQCDLDKGELVGSASIEVSEDGQKVTVTVEGQAGAWFKDAHVYAGCKTTPFKKDEPTVAPGQFPWKENVNDNTFVAEVDVDCKNIFNCHTIYYCDIYVIIHAEACEYHYHWD